LVKAKERRLLCKYHEPHKLYEQNANTRNLKATRSKRFNVAQEIVEDAHLNLCLHLVRLMSVLVLQ